MTEKKIEGIGVRFRVGKKTKDGKVIWDIENKHNFITEQGFDMLNTMPCVRTTEYVHLGIGNSKFVEECTCTVTYDVNTDTYSINTPNVSLDDYANKQVILSNNAAFAIEAPNGEDATLTPVDFTDMVSYPYNGVCIIVVDADGSLNTHYKSSNDYIPGEGTSRNLKYVDEENKLVYIENTRTVIFPMITASEGPVTITEIGWSPYREIDSDIYPLFGCKNIDVTYEESDSPYIQVSIVRRINYGTTTAPSPFNKSNTIDHSLPYSTDEFDPKDCSWIKYDGTSAPPNMDSFAEINIYDTDHKFDEYIDVMLTENDVQYNNELNHLEVLDRTLVNNIQNDTTVVPIPKQINHGSSRALRRQLFSGNTYIYGSDMYSDGEYNGQYIVPDKLQERDLDFCIDTTTDETHKYVSLLPYTFDEPIQTTRGEIEDVYVSISPIYNDGVKITTLYTDTLEPIEDLDGNNPTIEMAMFVDKSVFDTDNDVNIHNHTISYAVDNKTSAVWALIRYGSSYKFTVIYRYDPNERDSFETGQYPYGTIQDASGLLKAQGNIAIYDDILFEVALHKNDNSYTDSNYDVYASSIIDIENTRVLVYKGIYTLINAYQSDDCARTPLVNYPEKGNFCGVTDKYPITVDNDRLIVASDKVIWSYRLPNKGRAILNTTTPYDFNNDNGGDWKIEAQLTDIQDEVHTYATSLFVDRKNKTIVTTYLHWTNTGVGREYTAELDKVYGVVYGRARSYADAFTLGFIDIGSENVDDIYNSARYFIPKQYMDQTAYYGFDSSFNNNIGFGCLIDDIVVDHKNGKILIVLTDGYRHKNLKVVSVNPNSYTPNSITTKAPVNIPDNIAVSYFHVNNKSSCIGIVNINNNYRLCIIDTSSDSTTPPTRITGTDAQFNIDDGVYIKRLSANLFVYLKESDPNILHYIHHTGTSVIHEGFINLSNVTDIFNIDIDTVFTTSSMIYFAVAGNSILTFKYDITNSTMTLVYSTNAFADMNTTKYDTNGDVVSNTSFFSVGDGMFVSTSGAIATLRGNNDKKMVMISTFHDDVDIIDINMFTSDDDQYVITQHTDGSTSVNVLNTSNQLITKASMVVNRIPYYYKGIPDSFMRLSEFHYIGFDSEYSLSTYRMTQTGPIRVDSIAVKDGNGTIIPLNQVIGTDGITRIDMSVSERSDTTGGSRYLITYNSGSDIRFIQINIDEKGTILDKNNSIVYELSDIASGSIWSNVAIGDDDFVVINNMLIYHIHVDPSTGSISIIDSADALDVTMMTGQTISKYVSIDGDLRYVQTYCSILTGLVIQTLKIDLSQSDNSISYVSNSEHTGCKGCIPLNYDDYLLEHESGSDSDYIHIESGNEISKVDKPVNKFIYNVSSIATKSSVRNDDLYTLSVVDDHYALYRIVDNKYPVRMLTFDISGIESMRPLQLFHSRYGTYAFVKSDTGNYGYFFKLNIENKHTKSMSFFTDIGRSGINKIKNIYSKTYTTGDSTPIWFGEIQNGGDNVSISNDAIIELTSVWSRHIQS